MVLIGTKPDIIKQTPLVLELRRRRQAVILGTTGQHYDPNLTRDAWDLAGLTPDFDLAVRGTLYNKIGQIIERFGYVLDKILENDKIIIPYAHGDTTTAMAVSAAAFMNQVPVAHVEAGLRSFVPRYEVLDTIQKHFNFEVFKGILQNERSWQKGSIEPYPEQYNTRTIAPAAAFHAAPVELNRQNLLAEGFRADRITVVGNPVADAVALALKQPSDVFEEYPGLRQGFVRFAIHRRENIESRQLFCVIMETLAQLVLSGQTVLLVSHALTVRALKEYKLYAKFNKLARTYPNFVFEQRLLPYRDNIHTLTKAILNITDSGSEQEEGNIMGFATATARFGSDRPETIWTGGNILAPPINQKLFENVIRGALANPKLFRAPKLYGQKVVQKIVDEVLEIRKREKLFQWEHERFGYSKFDLIP